MNIAICKFCRKEFKAVKKGRKFCSRRCRSLSQIKQLKKVCACCGKSFTVPPYRKNTAKYCSQSCLAKIHLAKFAIHRFKPIENKQTKRKILVIDGRHILESRYVMENHLGRKLQTQEHVHHINGNLSDNSVENLVLLSKSEHQKVHALKRHNHP